MVVNPTVKLGWADIERDARGLAFGLEPHLPFKGILAVTRGGLIPATMLAHHLMIRTIETIGVTAYENNNIKVPKVVKDAPHHILACEGAGWLIVDDLVDTGTTMSIIRERLPLAKIAVLYTKPKGRYHADFFVQSYAQTTWLEFPWEQP